MTSEDALVDELARTLSDEQLAKVEEADGWDPTDHELVDFEYVTAGDLQFWRTPRGDAVLERARQIGRRTIVIELEPYVVRTTAWSEPCHMHPWLTWTFVLKDAGDPEAGYRVLRPCAHVDHHTPADPDEDLPLYVCYDTPDAWLTAALFCVTIIDGC